MTLRTVAAATTCLCMLMSLSLASAWADGMPDDEGFNPVPSKPGVLAPGVVQPPPIKNTKPAAKPVTKPTPAPVVAPTTPAPAAAPTPAPVQTPATAPAPVQQPAPTPTPAPAAAPEPATPTPPPTTTATAPVPAPIQPTAPPPTTSNGALARLHAVISIDVKLFERQPPLAEVVVKGVAPTGGWTNVTLRPVETKGGVLELELVGTPPSGPTTQVLTNTAAAVQINPLPDDVKMIRVVSQTNKALKVIR